MTKKTKILVAKPGLDGHDVGAKIVVHALTDAGFDVVYSGLKRTPQEIVQRAIEENVAVLGLSILSGSHIPLCEQIAKLLRERGLEDLPWIVGGSIPEKDHEELKRLGASAVFPFGTPIEKIVDFVRGKVQ